MANTQELITKAKDFDVANVSYKTPKLNKKGGKSMNINYSGKNLVLQFPLVMTWGVNEWDYDDGGGKKYDLNLQFSSPSSRTASEEALFQAMHALQEKVLDDAVKNSKEWFGKAKMSREVAEALMYPILKYRKDKQTQELDMNSNPTMKLKLPCWDGVFKVELYNMNKDPLYLPKNATLEDGPEKLVSSVPSRSHIKGLMECNGVWMAGGKFGVTWKLVQAQVRPPVRIQGFCILDDSDDDEAVAAIEAHETAEAEVHAAFDKDSSEEEEEEAPKPKKKKKKVVRKKKKVVASN